MAKKKTTGKKALTKNTSAKKPQKKKTPEKKTTKKKSPVKKTAKKKTPAKKTVKKKTSVKKAAKKTAKRPVKKASSISKKKTIKKTPVKTVKKSAKTIKPKNIPPVLYDLAAPTDLNRLELLIIDPKKIYLFWSISRQALRELKQYRPQANTEEKNLILKVHDVTDIIFDGNNAHKTWNFSVSSLQGNWFLHTNRPNRDFIARLCFKQSDRSLLEILRSNRVHTPRSGTSASEKQQWAGTDVHGPEFLQYIPLGKRCLDTPDFRPGSSSGGSHVPASGFKKKK